MLYINWTTNTCIPLTYWIIISFKDYHLLDFYIDSFKKLLTLIYLFSFKKAYLSFKGFYSDSWNLHMEAIYSSSFLRAIGKLAHTNSNYQQFYLGQETQAKVILLGLRRTMSVKNYRRSRAGCRLFHCIYTWVNQVGHHTVNPSTHYNRHQMTKMACKAINWSNLKKIDVQSSENNSSLIRCALVNRRSVVNKISEIKYEIAQSDLDLLALTETWIRDDNLTETQICPPGYKVLSIPQLARTGGGIALIYWDNLKSKGIQPTPSRQWSVLTLTYYYIVNLYTWPLSIDHQGVISIPLHQNSWMSLKLILIIRAYLSSLGT